MYDPKKHQEHQIEALRRLEWQSRNGRLRTDYDSVRESILQTPEIYCTDCDWFGDLRECFTPYEERFCPECKSNNLKSTE